MERIQKKLLRTSACKPKHPSPDGTRHTVTLQTVTKRDKSSGGRAKQDQALPKFLSLRSLKLIVSEEICGRFGYVSTDKLLHIDLLGLRSDDVRSASQFDVASLLW